MSEYNEALSRLEAPERPFTPRYWKRIPFLPYPDHTSTKEYNRILNEGKFSKLPKYSISQRFYITELDLGQDTYHFELDRSFVNASGDRKSIAIRNIQFDSMFRLGNITLHDFEMTLVNEPGVNLSINENGYIIDYSENYVDTIKDITIKSRNDILDVMSENIAKLIYKSFKKKIIKVLDKDRQQQLLKDYKQVKISRTVEYSNRKIRIRLTNCHLILEEPDQDVLFIMFASTDDPAVQKYVFGSEHEFDSIYKPTKIINNEEEDTIIFEFDFPDFMLYTIPISVCSTLNPYSCQNIIGSMNEKHDMLNKIYPYDNQNNFILWFNDEEGKRVTNTNITGYLDLELIIDNTNNLSLDV